MRRGSPVTKHVLLANQLNHFTKLPDTETAISKTNDPSDEISDSLNAIKPGCEGKDTTRAAGSVGQPQTHQTYLQSGLIFLRR